MHRTTLYTVRWYAGRQDEGSNSISDLTYLNKLPRVSQSPRATCQNQERSICIYDYNASTSLTHLLFSSLVPRPWVKTHSLWNRKSSHTPELGGRGRTGRSCTEEVTNMANVQRPLLTEEPAWKALQEYYDQNGSKINMAQMFKEDGSRFQKYRFEFTVINLFAASLGCVCVPVALSFCTL